jgi:hypothetical protein
LDIVWLLLGRPKKVARGKVGIKAERVAAAAAAAASKEK